MPACRAGPEAGGRWGSELKPHHTEKNGTETLDYLKSMLGQLRTMAEAEHYGLLAYLIDMAYIEASEMLRGERPSSARSLSDERDGSA